MAEIRFEDIHKQIQPDDLLVIPARMQQEKRWICWGGDKVPVSVGKNQSGEHFGIDVTNPGNWGTFTDVVDSLGDECFVKSLNEHFHVAGVGFVVGDGWFCADFDGGEKHRKEPVPDSVIEDVISCVGTYTELSLSGCGYHVFGKCDFAVGNDEPENNKPHRDENGNPLPDSYEVEFFTRRKFIVITGDIVPGSELDAAECNAAAKTLYERYIFQDWQRDEEKRKAEHQRVAATISINADDATQFFLLNYPEILAYSDSSNFKRGGKGHPLGPGEYSWIGAVKSMQQIGIPENDIIDWCRRGSNFKSERDVQKVLDEHQKPGKAYLGSIIQDAKNNGWKPDPGKLTGEYLRNHERAEQMKEIRSGYESRLEERIKRICEEIGVEYRPGLGYTSDWDNIILKVYDTETGEVIWQRDGGGDPGQGGMAAADGLNVHPAVQKKPEAVVKISNDISSFVRIMESKFPIRFNEMRQRGEVFMCGHWHDISDSDEAIIARYCQDVYNISNKQNLRDAILISQRINTVNPLQDKLCSIVWDKIPRTKYFLRDIMKCDDNKLTRTVSQMIFTGGIRRAFEPGCKWDNVPIFIGKQGSGKTTAVSLLGLGYSGLLRTFSGKEAIENISGLWIAEIGELAAVRKSKDLEEIKSFLSSTEDKYRKPYAHNDIIIPRRCVFIGTTNSNAFLSDQTGNRRFFPVNVHSDGKEIWRDCDEINYYIEQAWAEAVEQYHDGSLPKDYDHSIDDELNVVRDNYQNDDWKLSLIDDTLGAMEPGEMVCCLQLWIECLGMDREKLTMSDSRIIGEHLDNLPDWERTPNKPRIGRFGQQRAWRKIER